MQRLFGGLVFAVVCVGVPFAGGTEEGEPDAVGGTITLYTSESSSDVEGYVRQFELSNPGTTVAVFRLGTTELVARLLTALETGATPADVVGFADMALFERLAADGDLLAVDPPEAANIPENYVYFGIPLYGISVGMYRNRKPWIGAVAFPALGETFFCDGRNAYLMTGPDATERVRLEAPHTELDANSVMLLTNGYLRKFDWSYDVCTMLVTACASLNGCWPAVRRGIGTVITDHIWDFGGYRPILDTLGFDLRGAESGRSMTQYRATDYEAGSLLVREPVIVSRPEHFARLQSAIHPKAQRER